MPRAAKPKPPPTPEQLAVSVRTKAGIAKSALRERQLIEQALLLSKGKFRGVRQARLESQREKPFDLCWEEQGLLVEIDGGFNVPGGGRHSRLKGVMVQCEKRNKAVLNGWRVLVFTTQQVDRGEALPVILKALEATEAPR